MKPCNTEIYEKGKTIAVFDAGKEAMEGLVKEARRSGLRIDWHYFGGRAVVKTLDDPKKSLTAIEKAIPRRID